MSKKPPDHTSRAAAWSQVWGRMRSLVLPPRQYEPHRLLFLLRHPPPPPVEEIDIEAFVCVSWPDELSRYTWRQVKAVAVLAGKTPSEVFGVDFQYVERMLLALDLRSRYASVPTIGPYAWRAPGRVDVSDFVALIQDLPSEVLFAALHGTKINLPYAGYPNATNVAKEPGEITKCLLTKSPRPMIALHGMRTGRVSSPTLGQHSVPPWREWREK